MGWLRRQWNDIKGNVKYAALVALWWLVIDLCKRLLRYIPNFPTWAIWAILLGLSLLMLVGLLWFMKNTATKPTQAIQSSGAVVAPGILTLSALQGQRPVVNFDAREYFRLAYHSPVTAEIETNIKIAAEQNQPGDHEGFYARFIGIGVVSYMHDMTWAYIFKSQLLMLAEANHRNGHLPLHDAKVYYDNAVANYPRVYESYSFQQWLNYVVVSEQLLVRHPSDMLEITHRGKDFLKYLAHWGRDANAKSG